ncbi:MAG: hypothetical protein EXR66_00400 [Dehalococcoidia bacterium]|nr:hypothetical protein [Dehalococcoidia bacterium]
MDRLAIFGWTYSTPALAAALAEGADLEAAAVGDERSAALARARGALGVPCFHHVRAMARVADFDVALIGGVEGAADIAEAAARRGADILLDGVWADGETLNRAAEAATRYGVALVVLRPWLRAAGVPSVVARLAAAPADLLLIDAVEDRPAMLLLRDLVALTARIMGAETLDVAASPAGSPDNTTAIAVQLRLADDRVASITARRGAHAALRLVASSGGSSVMLRREGTETIIDGAPDVDTAAETILIEASGTSAESKLLLTEAKRVPEARSAGSIDGLLAAGEGLILSAVERALDHGFAEHVDEHARPSLRLLRDGGQATVNAPRGALSLVRQ